MRSHRRQAGFNIVELIISMCIVAVLSSIAIAQMRDYTRRARMSEVILAANQCKNMVAESYPVFDSVPPPGGWGCEGSSATRYAGAVQTSEDGVIRVAIANLDVNMNGRYLYLVPARADGVTAMNTTNDLGNGVRAWMCGSDLAYVRNALPANCRVDTATFATQDFGP
jgi:type IV pilus assembly protein PilA